MGKYANSKYYQRNKFLLVFYKLLQYNKLLKKYPYSKLFWSLYSHIQENEINVYRKDHVAYN